ncbi:MAG: B12-binding domain-containing radical SAM protein [Epulopiscium sp.]|nr:B12-binding domain-containing radical SAM protein [Candidatus Epulonipiscium sp.]
MKIVLAAINAKFIHSSLAIRSIREYCQGMQEHIELEEYTINQKEDFILWDIYRKKPDMVCFSCYLWNISMINSIIDNLKKIMPHVPIVLGGPEVSYEAEEYLEKHLSADLILRGEGEATFREMVELFLSGVFPPEAIDGVTYREGENIISNPARAPLSLDEIPFVYHQLDDLKNRILYYETQRGCPYQCQYCLSSIEKGVRFLSPQRVEQDLQFFLDQKVRQVKFVDRTFNANPAHAKHIWRYLMEHDNGFTNFHMEITADIMDEESILLLKDARPGLFQFEIGVQSTNEKTIEAIQRNTYFEKLKIVVKKIQEAGNIHQHLDLIAGLPYEDYASFRNSFNDVYELRPEQFQLGFLKMLKGSGLRRDAEKYGIVYREEAVYEILFTKDLPYEDVLRLKLVEEMVETYYNSGKAWHTLQYVVPFFTSAFDFYEALGEYWEKKEYHKVQHNKMQLFQILDEFFGERKELEGKQKVWRGFLKWDMLLAENLRSMPAWLEEPPAVKGRKWDFFHDKEKTSKLEEPLANLSVKDLSARCGVGYFEFRIFDMLKNPKADAVWEETMVLFDYGDRNPLTNHATWYVVS